LLNRNFQWLLYTETLTWKGNWYNKFLPELSRRKENFGIVVEFWTSITEKKYMSPGN
jgi:hypothetical protein